MLILSQERLREYMMKLKKQSNIMEITLTWHFILMIFVSIILIMGVFKEEDSSLDFSNMIYLPILVIIWLIYGGIFIW